MKPYRLKHKPTGLYYTPVKGRFEYMSNLSKKGRVYLTKANVFIGSHVNGHIYIYVSVPQYKAMKDIFDSLGIEKYDYESVYRLRCPQSDFEIEYFKEE